MITCRLNMSFQIQNVKYINNHPSPSMFVHMENNLQQRSMKWIKKDYLWLLAYCPQRKRLVFLLNIGGSSKQHTTLLMFDKEGIRWSHLSCLSLFISSLQLFHDETPILYHLNQSALSCSHMKFFSPCYIKYTVRYVKCKLHLQLCTSV